MTTLIFFLIISVAVALAVWLWKAASDPLGEQRDNAAKEWNRRRARKALTEANSGRVARKYTKN